MASIKQLTLVCDIEKQKLEKLHATYIQTKNYLFEQQQKLSGLENYRLDYIGQIKQQVALGVAAKTLIQHQNFVGKLDKACEQQINIINQAVLVVDQRKQHWMKQQQKYKAVLQLISRRQKQLLKDQNKQEQLVLNEFAIQQYHRRHARS